MNFYLSIHEENKMHDSAMKMSSVEDSDNMVSEMRGSSNFLQYQFSKNDAAIEKAHPNPHEQNTDLKKQNDKFRTTDSSALRYMNMINI